MFCVKCGNRLNEGARFCVKCGNQVAGNPVTAEETPRMVPPQMTYQMPADVLSSPAEEPKKKTGIIIAGCVIIALIAIIAGLLAIVVLQRSTSADKKREEVRIEEDVSVTKEEKKAEEEKIVADSGETTGTNDTADSVPSTSLPGTTDTVSVGESIAAQPKTDVTIDVRQVDNTAFPNMALYTKVSDYDGNNISDLSTSDFVIQEIDGNGKTSPVTLSSVFRVLNQDKINVNLVLDASGSMDEYSKMQQAKDAAKAFIHQMNLGKGDQVEIISFDDYVYMQQGFSNSEAQLDAAIDNIVTGGMTALYDGLYSGLYQTYYEQGAKCVIGFTDGEENASSYTFEDVVYMAKNTGIPVFLIGIGDDQYDVDVNALQSLAEQCGGKYYSANVLNLQSILEDIYLTIYREQQDYYVLKYTATNTDNMSTFRNVKVTTSDSSAYAGNTEKSYIPRADVAGAFSESYRQRDFMLDFSSVREVTESDLNGMSLAQLRIARNEIFARHGRQFKDSMLNQWFYSKVWYLNIPYKYSPDDFDTYAPNPLSALELQNANFIREYENNIMSTRDIYPEAGSVRLSEYDLGLSKNVLKQALEQMQTYPNSAILEENIRMVQAAINKEDVQY